MKEFEVLFLFSIEIKKIFEFDFFLVLPEIIFNPYDNEIVPT